MKQATASRGTPRAMLKLRSRPVGVAEAVIKKIGKGRTVNGKGLAAQYGLPDLDVGRDFRH